LNKRETAFQLPYWLERERETLKVSSLFVVVRGLLGPLMALKSLALSERVEPVVCRTNRKKRDTSFLTAAPDHRFDVEIAN
jgi:hypothetical protein